MRKQSNLKVHKCNSSSSSSSKKHCDKKKKVEPVVGTHGINFTIFTNIPALRTDVFGVTTFHADGTFIFHASEFLTQSIGGNQGVLDTALMGIWKKVSKRTYKGIGEFVQLFRDPVNPALPAVPMYRWKAELVFKINHDEITGAMSATATPHPKDDLELNKTAPPPFTGLVLETSGVTRKLTQ